ncbi:Colicin V secretion ABC transporter ATP-binding protein (fragment) [Xanthomonas citri pv. citri]
MQDDCLFSGTIADNVAFFDSSAELSKIEAAARAAGIHDDIVKMPMGYETLVGDMGSTLSGGQKQRILLARALYTQPKILVLDEATSHLDSKNEKVVNDAVMDLEITRIIIAHREQTIAMADRVFDLSRQTWIR